MGLLGWTPSPGNEETAAAVGSGVSSSASLVASRQGEAETFIKENGHDAMQHVPVTAETRSKGG